MVKRTVLTRAAAKIMSMTSGRFEVNPSEVDNGNIIH